MDFVEIGVSREIKSLRDRDVKFLVISSFLGFNIIFYFFEFLEKVGY